MAFARTDLEQPTLGSITVRRMNFRLPHTFTIISTLEDAACTRNSDAIDQHRTGRTEVVDVGCQPGDGSHLHSLNRLAKGLRLHASSTEVDNTHHPP